MSTEDDDFSNELADMLVENFKQKDNDPSSRVESEILPYEFSVRKHDGVAIDPAPVNAQKVDNIEISENMLAHEETTEYEADQQDGMAESATFEDDGNEIMPEITREIQNNSNNNGKQIDILAKICDDKRRHIDRQKALISEYVLRRQVSLMPHVRGFLSSINNKIALGENALIAEIKRASPSKGVIRDNFIPSEIARDYELGGATCLSVLTDGPYFQGRDEYLDMAKRACNLPILRKDFILDPYQVLESRALDADCILLIMAAVSDPDAIAIENEAVNLGMDVLIEIHNEEELQRALNLRSMLIGINNRNLKTLEVDLTTTQRLAPMISSPRTIVCESGIYKNEDVLKMNNSGVKAFLVGESLMREGDIVAATRGLLGNM